MKALSLTQPWASLVALGHKRIETRSWSTRYRGVIAIHASRGFPMPARDIAATIRFEGVVELPLSLPLGAIIATARLVDVRRTEAVRGEISSLERSLGDYSPNRFAWFFEDALQVTPPIPKLGSLGLWEWS